MTTFSHGQVIYLRDGTKATYLHETSDGHLVSLLLEIDDYNGACEVDGPLQLVNELWAKAPRQVRDAELVAVEETIRQRRQELAEIERELRRLEAGKAATMARAKDDEWLSIALDLLEGRELFAVRDGSYKVWSTYDEDFLELKNTWASNFDYLALGRRRHKDGVTWSLVRRSGGDSYYTPTWLFRERAKAEEKLADLVADRAEHVLRRRGFTRDNFIEALRRDGHPIPPAITEQIQAEKQAAREAEIAKAKAILAKEGAA